MAIALHEASTLAVSLLLDRGASWLINLKTAKTLGLAVPLSLLGRADEVIE